MVATSDCSIKPKIINGKKVSKPLMEKKRRARINKCLDQLKSLLENYYTNNIRKRKLEKADILELTVKHLRNLQKIQSGSSIEFNDYQAGFRSCLAGVNQYLLMADSSGSSRLNMLTHLSSSLLCAGGQPTQSSTADSDSGKHAVPEAVTQRLLPSIAGHEANKTPATVPLVRCVRALKPHSARMARVPHSQPTESTGEWRFSGATTAASTHNTQEKKSSSPCQKKKRVSVGPCSNDVIGTTLQNIWRPW